MAHTWMSHVIYANHQCHIHQCTTSWLMNNVCHIHSWVMSHIRMSTWRRRLSYINDWVVSHTSTICMNESCHIHQWRTSRINMSHVTFIHECVAVRGEGGGGVRDISRITRTHTYTYTLVADDEYFYYFKNQSSTFSVGSIFYMCRGRGH